MTKITTRFVLLVATAAVAPLMMYGIVSIESLNSGTRQSVIGGNLNVAARAAEHIELYMATNLKVLQAVAADLQNTGLEPWQQDRILKNYVIEFPEIRELTLFDSAGKPIVSSRVGPPQLLGPPPENAAINGQYIAPITVDDDSLPTTTMAVRLEQPNRKATWLVGEVRLEELWRMVDRIRVGEEGFALVLSQQGELIAHGDPDEKARVARNENLSGHPVMVTLRERERALRSPAPGGPPGGNVEGSPGVVPAVPLETEYTNAQGRELLAVAAPIEALGWTVIVEQPTDEAYAIGTRLARQLVVVIVLALLVTIALGYLWGRSFIRPIFALMRGTRAIAAGNLGERVQIGGHDEFHQLGTDFNRMADRLVELRDDVRKQERQATFGRLAAGLVHDIAHPIHNITNSCKLILKMFHDRDYRDTFKRTVDREHATLTRTLDDLRELARPRPLEHFPVDINRAVAEAVESMQSVADTAAVSIAMQLRDGPLYIAGDLFGLGRVYRNLLQNAIDASSRGGTITVTTRERGDRVGIEVSDTGCGIAPDRLAAIFEDFETTKRRGLGLGLAISRKIVEQLSGTITATSEVGSGTTFLVEFPNIPAPVDPPSATSHAGSASPPHDSGVTGMGEQHPS